MTTTQYAGLLGFAFVAAWIIAGFGNAVLCLVGALVFAGGAAFARGELDLSDVQERLRGATGGYPAAAPPPPRAPVAPRVR